MIAALAGGLLTLVVATISPTPGFDSFGSATPTPRATATVRASVKPSVRPSARPPSAVRTSRPLRGTVPAATSRPTYNRPSPSSSGIGLSSTAVVDRYETHVAAYQMPAIVSFVYTVEQAGARGGLSQQHRIYRSETVERDETIVIQGNRIKPRIRIFRNKTDAYALAALAPRRSAYSFTSAGEAHDGGRLLYLYRTVPLDRTAGYTVTMIGIDAQTFLPATIEFLSNGSVLNGRGHLRFGSVERAWVVLEAEASAQAGKHSFREHMVFSDYHFPRSLPTATFGNLEP